LTGTGPESVKTGLHQGGQNDFSAKNHSSTGGGIFRRKIVVAGLLGVCRMRFLYRCAALR